MGRQALRQFTKAEKLTVDNAYKCTRCKKKVVAIKQMVIQKAPTVLTIQLKRFDFVNSYGGKLNKHVEFPTDLDLAPHMTKRGKPVGYSLYAVLVHAGHSVQSGHYYAFVKSPNGSWYRMDDDSVSMVKLSTVLAQKAYILFYLRKSLDPKPAPIASTLVTAAAPSPKETQTAGAALDAAKARVERLKTVKAAMATASVDETPAKAEKTTKKKAAGVTDIFDQFDRVQAAAGSSDEDDDDDDEVPTVKNISEKKAGKMAKNQQQGAADVMLQVDEPVICTHGGWEATYYFAPKETAAPAQAQEVAEDAEETEIGWEVNDIVSSAASETVAGGESAAAASSDSSSSGDDSGPTRDSGEEESGSDEDAESSKENSADSEDGEVMVGTSRKRPVKVVEWDAQLNEDGTVAKRQKSEGVSLWFALTVAKVALAVANLARALNHSHAARFVFFVFGRIADDFVGLGRVDEEECGVTAQPAREPRAAGSVLGQHEEPRGRREEGGERPG